MSRVLWFGWSLSVEELLTVSHLLGVLFLVLFVTFIVLTVKVHQFVSHLLQIGLEARQVQVDRHDFPDPEQD